MNNSENEWTYIDSSKSKHNLLIDLKLILSNIFLVKALIHRDFVAVFKQTIVGPAWFVIQPLATTIVFTIIFGRVAEISTDGTPSFLFYFSGVLLWAYFTSNVGKVSELLFENAHLLNKTYFPIMIIPFTNLVINIFRASIQIAVFIFFLFYYKYLLKIDVDVSVYSPLILLLSLFLVSAISIGIGLIFSALTIKYKDLSYINSFVIGLLMYITPVIYPISSSQGKLKTLLLLNPISSIIELLRVSFLGQGYFNYYWYFYSFIFCIVTFYIGYIMMKKVSANFVDTI